MDQPGHDVAFEEQRGCEQHLQQWRETQIWDVNIHREAVSLQVEFGARQMIDLAVPGGGRGQALEERQNQDETQIDSQGPIETGTDG